jgi:hypothetical protein
MAQETKAMNSTVTSDSLSRFEHLAAGDATAERVCAELAKVFHTKPDEVALLKSEKAALRFLFPPGLKTAGSIPLTSPAVAARTAATRSALLSNNFAKVKHVRIFEEVKTGIPSEMPERMPIQKLMSAPVLTSAGQVVGVVQISRKGFDPASAGPDFTGQDLKLLEQAASVIAAMDFMR